MPRQGLNKEVITKSAREFIKENGYSSLTLAALAKRLDVKPPALFKHFKNLEEIKEVLALQALVLLKQQIQDAVTGVAKEEALKNLCQAYRDFAKENPGLYHAMQPSYFGKNNVIDKAGESLLFVIASVLKGFGVKDDNLIHLIRVIRSSLHGFILLEIEGGFGMPQDIELTFKMHIDMILKTITYSKE